jgi:hypothetical protein
MDQAGAAKHGRSSRSLGVDWEVGEQAAFGIGKGAGNLVKARERCNGVAQAAQAVNQNPFYRGIWLQKAGLLEQVSEVLIKSLKGKKRILRLTTPKLKDIWGPVRSE